MKKPYAYIRCSCGYWREYEAPTEAAAEAQYEEWQREHAAHARAGGVVAEGSMMQTLSTAFGEDGDM